MKKYGLKPTASIESIFNQLDGIKLTVKSGKSFEEILLEYIVLKKLRKISAEDARDGLKDSKKYSLIEWS